MKKLVAVATLSLATVIAGPAIAQEEGPSATPPPAAEPAAPAAGEPAPAAPASGDEEAPEGDGTGLRFGARLGYMIPLGDATEGSALSDAISGGVPIWLDVGYRITRNFYIGGYFNYAFLSAADNVCPSGADCSASQLRFGAMGAFHFLPTEKFDPWVGLGLGYEIASVSASAGAISVDTSIKGPEFLNLQLGGDYRATDNFRVGPFASFSVGQYSTVSSGGNSADIDKTALHQWLTFGVRGAYDL